MRWQVTDNTLLLLHILSIQISHLVSWDTQVCLAYFWAQSRAPRARLSEGANQHGMIKLCLPKNSWQPGLFSLNETLLWKQANAGERSWSRRPNWKQSREKGREGGSLLAREKRHAACLQLIYKCLWSWGFLFPIGCNRERENILEKKKKKLWSLSLPFPIL